MDNLSSITTIHELVAFLSEFLEKVPTQEYVDKELDKRVSVDALGILIPKLVSRIDFDQRMNAKVNKADLINAVSGKADRNEVASGIARKANLSMLYNLMAKVNKAFPFKTVENIVERNALTGEDLNKVILVIDASGDPNVSIDSRGAMYMYSHARRQWILESEIKYNDAQITYNNIHGKPESSAREIDTVVSVIIERIEFVRKLHEIYTKMHVHNHSVEEIDNAVDEKHSHQHSLEIMTIHDDDLIPVIRDGVLVNVKAHVLKSYINQ